MRHRRGAGAACVAAIAATVGLVPAASAGSTRIRDASGDVARADSGANAREPRVDILSVDVLNEARQLELTIAVAEVVPLDDPAWEDFSLQLTAFIGDPNDDDAFWFWDVANGAASIVSFDDFAECATDVAVDEDANHYVLTAGPECVQALPRSIQVGVSLAFDDDPEDEDFDVAYDAAPDDDLSGPIGASGGPAVTRLAGADRIATAVALSADRYDDGEAAAAVLVESNDLVDAVVAGPLGAAKTGPLLLTGGTALDPRVAAELERAVEPGSDVLLVGGTGVLSDSIVSDLRGRGFRPRRIAGATRYDTAIAVADEIGDHPITLIADGNAPREQLIASAAAASLGGVLVLSNGGDLSRPTDDFIANDAGRHVAVGRAAYASPGAERITGANAAELSQHVLDRLLPDVGLVGVVGPEGIVGAVAAVPHLATLHGGLLMSSRDQLSPVVGAELKQRSGSLREVVLYGGTGALAAAVEQSVRSAVGASSTAGT